MISILRNGGLLALSLGALSFNTPCNAQGAVNASIKEIGIQLENGPTQLDRNAILASNTDWLFDFFAQKSYTYSPGAVINANAATFPATVGNGLTMSWVTLGPCAMQPPHYHPRASNYIVSIHGNVQTYMITENGAPLVTNLLTPGKMTLFPKGSLHAMQNTGNMLTRNPEEIDRGLTFLYHTIGCDNVTLVSALGTEDPGTHNVANGLFNLPHDMVAAAFGSNHNLNLTDAMKSIPPVGAGVALGSSTCRAQCNIQ
ncbi:spherulin-1A [Xylariaceae sp. FL1651]|nr:spherulin-1A [Xylariaceae sp. FL1651]